ncbi:MAG: ABC transporter permease [Magnetospirillum sp.]|nr:ABC transporter permease [Magnetospirillum sp.]
MSRLPGTRRRRLVALVRKEVLQVVRDPSSIVIALVLPVVLLLLFGYGVSLDADEVSLAVVVEQPAPSTERLVDSFANSPFFRITELRSRQDAEAGMVAGRWKGVVIVADDFLSRAERYDDAPIQVLLDGTDSNTARLVRGYVEGVWAKWLEQEGIAHARSSAPAVSAEARVWFNPELLSRNFLVPGLIAINLTLTGTLLTALVVAREWERGTMEALIATPVSVLEILAGKLAPYFVLGMGGMALSVALAILLFHVPFRGSAWVLIGVSALFLSGALGMGLLISSVARSQFVAGQVAIISAFLPAFMLSGFVFEPSSAPTWIEILSHAVAARYFVSILQTLFLAGDVWSVILPNVGALVLIAVVFLGLTLTRTGKRLA